MHFADPAALLIAFVLKAALALPSPVKQDSLTGNSPLQKQTGTISGDILRTANSEVCHIATSSLSNLIVAQPIDSVAPIKSLTASESQGRKSTHTDTRTTQEQKQGSSKEIEAVSIRKRGAVGNAAGQIVTGLMVVGLLKQLYNAVAPALQSHTQQRPPSPYAYGPQYSMQARGINGVDQSHPPQNASNQADNDESIMVRRQVMDIASHFVNLGFAVQTVQENVGPISREIIRLEHEALHNARKWMHPEQQSSYMQKRNIPLEVMKGSKEATSDIAERRFDRRSMMDSVLEHPTTAKVANSANILVTISMLTGMAGRYIDQLIQKAKTMIHGSAMQPTQRSRYQYGMY